jgi:ribonuclease HI
VNSLSLPQFVLIADSHGEPAGGWWRFVLRPARGPMALDVTDCEAGVHGQRLELLAAVRGLEALEQPSEVTLVTCSRYVRHGLEHGLSEWRDNGWTWEAYGERVPISNADLWQRLERAASIHRIRCRPLARPAPAAGSAASLSCAETGPRHRVDAAHAGVPSPRGRLVRSLRNLVQSLVGGRAG